MKETPLIQAHRDCQAKLVDFSGWLMPIQYSGVLDEYHTVRQGVGIFDVSHMGRIQISGTQAEPFLQWISTNDVSRLQVGQAQYSMVCRENGGILDDIFLYKTAPDAFLVCANASNREKIVNWFRRHQQNRFPGADIQDRSQNLAQIAIQGPQSSHLVRKVFGPQVSMLKPRQVVELRQQGGWTGLLSRTGYTGEIGYEWYLPAEMAMQAWRALLDAGEEDGVSPAGLGARDLLRLDVGYLLYGNDMDERVSPLEANAEWVVAWHKERFQGKEAMRNQKERGLSRQLVGFKMNARGIPRQGMSILKDGQSVGQVTSGNFSPSLQRGIGLGYLPLVLAREDTEVYIDIRGKFVPAHVAKPPFYKRGKS